MAIFGGLGDLPSGYNDLLPYNHAITSLVASDIVQHAAALSEMLMTPATEFPTMRWATHCTHSALVSLGQRERAMPFSYSGACAWITSA